jgi:hypothetical protein
MKTARSVGADKIADVHFALVKMWGSELNPLLHVAKNTLNISQRAMIAAEWSMASNGKLEKRKV